MGISQIFTMERMTGTVLIASFISFAIGGTLPIVGEKRNRRMFNLCTIAVASGEWRVICLSCLGIAHNALTTALL